MIAAACGDAATPDNQCPADSGEPIERSICNEFFDTEGAASEGLRADVCRGTIGFFVINRASDSDDDRTVAGTAGPLDVCFDGTGGQADLTGQIGYRELDLSYTDRTFPLTAFVQDAWIIEPLDPARDGELVEITVGYSLETEGFESFLTIVALQDVIADEPSVTPTVELGPSSDGEVRLFARFGDALQVQLRFEAGERTTADVSFRWNGIRLVDGDGNDDSATLRTDSGVDWVSPLDQ